MNALEQNLYLADGLSGAQVSGSIISLVIFIYILVDVWRSPASTGYKVGWSLFGFFCSLLALIVWLVWGRKRAYSGTA
jgi:hypothetical protein